MSNEIRSSAEQMAGPDEINAVYNTALALSELAAQAGQNRFIDREPPQPPAEFFAAFPPADPNSRVTYDFEADATPDEIRAEIVLLDYDAAEAPAVPITTAVVSRVEHFSGAGGVIRSASLFYTVFESPTDDPAKPNRKLLKDTVGGTKADDVWLIKPEHMFPADFVPGNGNTPAAVGPAEAALLTEYMTDTAVARMSKQPQSEEQ